MNTTLPLKPSEQPVSVGLETLTRRCSKILIVICGIGLAFEFVTGSEWFWPACAFLGWLATWMMEGVNIRYAAVIRRLTHEN